MHASAQGAGTDNSKQWEKDSCGKRAHNWKDEAQDEAQRKDSTTDNKRIKELQTKASRIEKVCRESNVQGALHNEAETDRLLPYMMRSIRKIMKGVGEGKGDLER